MAFSIRAKVYLKITRQLQNLAHGSRANLCDRGRRPPHVVVSRVSRHNRPFRCSFTNVRERSLEFPWDAIFRRSLLYTWGLTYTHHCCNRERRWCSPLEPRDTTRPYLTCDIRLTDSLHLFFRNYTPEHISRIERSVFIRVTSFTKYLYYNLLATRFVIYNTYGGQLLRRIIVYLEEGKEGEQKFIHSREPIGAYRSRWTRVLRCIVCAVGVQSEVVSSHFFFCCDAGC